MVLVGVQPSLMQVPPTCTRSTRAVRLPDPASAVASGPAACPEPRMMASYAVVIGISPVLTGPADATVADGSPGPGGTAPRHRGTMRRHGLHPPRPLGTVGEPPLPGNDELRTPDHGGGLARHHGSRPRPGLQLLRHRQRLRLAQG